MPLFLYRENHSLYEWFKKAYGDEQKTICRKVIGKIEVSRWIRKKPPLCKGRCQPIRLTEGLFLPGRITNNFCGFAHLQQSPSQKSKIFASPLYTRGPLGSARNKKSPEVEASGVFV